MTRRREDIQFYFGVVKTILYERTQPVEKGSKVNIIEYLTWQAQFCSTDNHK